MAAGGNDKMKWLRLAVSTGIMAILFWRISFKEVIAVFGSLAPVPLLISLPLIALVYVFRAWKWQMMLRSVAVQTPLSYNYKAVIKGIFYGLATPGRAGELARALSFEKKGAALATVVWEKITDAFFVVFLCGVSLVLFFQSKALFWMIGAAAIMVLGASAILVDGRFIAWITKLFPVPPTIIQEYQQQTKQLAWNGKLNAWMLVPAAGYYLISYVIAWLLLISLEPTLPPMLIFSFPIIVLLSNVPISFSGIGVREAVTSITFHAVGADPVYGASYGFLLFFMITVVPGLIGGVLHHYEH